jgi:single-stranded DNA-binding protein
MAKGGVGMSAGFNQVVTMGRLIAPPERISTKSGSLMIKATLEFSSYRRGADGVNEEQVTRLAATLFGKLAETFEKYVELGHLVQLVGRLDGFERKAKGGGSWLTLSFVVEQLILLPNECKRPSFEPPKNSASTVPKSAPERDWERPAELRPVPLTSEGEPSELPF